MSKNITAYAFLLVFKIVKSLQRFLKLKLLVTFFQRVAYSGKGLEKGSSALFNFFLLAALNKSF